MIIEMNKFCISAILSAMALTAVAEDPLTKEIVVEKDYIPVEQKANKVSSSAQTIKLKREAGEINFSDWNSPVETGNGICTMSPYGYRTSRTFSSHRGYLDASAGSFLNINASAGFRIVDGERTKLNLWLQHNSTWGMDNPYTLITPSSSSELTTIDYEQKFINDVVGLDLINSFRDGRLTIGANYHFARLNYLNQEVDGPEWFNNINEVHANVGYEGGLAERRTIYEIGADINHFGNSVAQYYGLKSSDWHLRFNAGISQPFGDENRIGIDMLGEYLSSESEVDAQHAADVPTFSNSRGKLRFTPFYTYAGERMNFRLGANLDVSFSDGTILRVSPDASFGYTFTPGFAFFAEARGGKDFNTFSRMFALNRYTFAAPAEAFCSSYTVADAKAGFKIGPFSGFNATLNAGWGKVCDAIMPTCDVFGGSRWNIPGTPYYNDDLAGFWFGGRLSYDYSDVVSVAVEGRYSKQDSHDDYAFGIDRPEYIVNASLKVRPIRPLSIGVAYEYRGGRQLWHGMEVNGMPMWYSEELGNVNNLSASARYDFSEKLAVTINANNILGHEWEMAPFYSAQKFGIMGGVSLKF